MTVLDSFSAHSAPDEESSEAWACTLAIGSLKEDCHATSHPLKLALSGVLIAACVTINVYFLARPGEGRGQDHRGRLGQGTGAGKNPKATRLQVSGRRIHGEF
jgi:hypothetical protein